MAQRNNSTRTELSESKRSKDLDRLFDNRRNEKTVFFVLQISSDELT